MIKFIEFLWIFFFIPLDEGNKIIPTGVVLGCHEQFSLRGLFYIVDVSAKWSSSNYTAMKYFFAFQVLNIKNGNCFRKQKYFKYWIFLIFYGICMCDACQVLFNEIWKVGRSRNDLFFKDLSCFFVNRTFYAVFDYHNKKVCDLSAIGCSIGA